MNSDTAKNPTPRFSKSRALAVLDALTARIAERQKFDRSGGTAQLHADGDQAAMIDRAVQFGRMRALEQFACSIEEGFAFDLTEAEEAGQVGAVRRALPVLLPPGSVASRLNNIAMEADAAVNIGGARHMSVTLSDLADRLLALAELCLAPSPLTVIRWAPISSAPNDGSVILVDDNYFPGAKWAAAKWVAGDDWSGWAYDDDTLNDSAPMGPLPTKWLAGLDGTEPGVAIVSGVGVPTDLLDAERWRILEAGLDSHGVVVSIPDSGGKKWDGQAISNAGDLQDWADAALKSAGAVGSKP